MKSECKLTGLDRSIDYSNGYDYNKTENLSSKKNEVPDGLISRLRMNDTEEIQKSLRYQINKIINKI